MDEGNRANQSPAMRPTAAVDLPEETERIVAIMGGAERKGHWEPAAQISVFAFWGGAKLDFREAELLEGETVLNVFALMGGVTILVPRDIDVEVEGSGIMGGFTHLSQRADDDNAPFLRVTGLAVMGGVEIKAK